MAGTRDGGKKAVAKIKAYEPGFYARIGAIGGKVHRPETRHFALDRKMAKKAGKLGGYRSSRTPKQV